MAGFVHLHTHSDFSFLQSIADIDSLLNAAYETDAPAIALTDSGNMFGILEMYSKLTQFNKKNKTAIKLIFGSELYIRMNNNLYQLVLLAENMIGYHNLIKLVSYSYENYRDGSSFITADLLKKYKSGLICLSGNRKGVVTSHIRKDNIAAARKKAFFFKELFGPERFYLELQNHYTKEDEKVIKQILTLKEETGLPVVACSEVFYISRDDSYAQEVMLCISQHAKMEWKKGISHGQRQVLPGKGYHFKTLEEMQADFTFLPEAVDNAFKIASVCDVPLSLKPRPHWPVIQLPGNQSPLNYLRKECFSRLKNKVTSVTDNYIKRLNYELKVIESMDFAAYFLIVADFVNYAKNKGILVGPGRGSAAGSLVSYCMGITDLDPLAYELLFERFLNPDRIDLPDVDIDFQDNRREEVIEYIRNKYGSEVICQIVTYNKLKAKQVLKDVARVFGLDFNTANRLSALIPQNYSLQQAFDTVPEFSEAIMGEPLFQRIFQISLKLEGLTRQTGIHAAGVIIADQDITNYIPTYRTEEEPEIVCTQFEGPRLEKECGLIKMDFLGLRTLSIIDDVLKLIKKNHDQHIDIEALSTDDKDTYRLFAEGKTAGVFQFESEGMRKYLKELKPASIHDLIAMNAMYRPGPMAWIPVYIAARHGRQPFFRDQEKENDYNHLKKLINKYEKLKKILEPTNNIPIYQEQIMKIGQELAGFSLGKADIMRKAVAKKKTALIPRIKKEFIKGCVETGMEETEAVFFFAKIIMPFSGYGFNKAHAASYAVVAYRTAYLKVKYASEFMTALLNSEIEKTDEIKKYIEEAKSMNLKIIPPDINESELIFTTDGIRISYGLGAIKGVARAAGSVILNERKQNGSYLSFVDFLKRNRCTKVNKQVVEQLIRAGVFDSLGLNAVQLLKVYPKLEEQVAKETQFARGGQLNIFTSHNDKPFDYSCILDRCRSFKATHNQLKEEERTGLGLLLKYDPILKYGQQFNLVSNVDLAKAEQWPDGREIKLAGIISKYRQHFTREKNEEMAFIAVDNMQGSADVVVFPSTLNKIKKIIKQNKKNFFQLEYPVIITGRYQKNEKGEGIIASEIVPFSEDKIPKKSYQQLHIQFSHPQISEDQLAGLKDVLHHYYGGHCLVYLHFQTGTQKEITVEADNLRILPGKKLYDKLIKLQFVARVWYS